MFLASSCSCLYKIYWSQLFSSEWRCSWNSANRRCSHNIWVTRLLPIKLRLILEVRGYIWTKDFHVPGSNTLIHFREILSLVVTPSLYMNQLANHLMSIMLASHFSAGIDSKSVIYSISFFTCVTTTDSKKGCLSYILRLSVDSSHSWSDADNISWNPGITGWFEESVAEWGFTCQMHYTTAQLEVTQLVFIVYVIHVINNRVTCKATGHVMTSMCIVGV